MSPSIARAWSDFANQANWLGLHQLDLARFAAFIKAAHNPEMDRDPMDFQALIEEAEPGLSEEQVGELSSQLDALYAFGHQVLSA